MTGIELGNPVEVYDKRIKPLYKEVMLSAAWINEALRLDEAAEY